MEIQYYCDLPGRDLTIPDAGSVTWCDIEPGCFQKAQDVRDFGTLVTNLGFRYGTYGNKTSISAVFGDSEELAQWPLWYADYRDPDYSTFVPFNGFTAPVLWQWSTTGWWTPAGVINADVSITPDGRVFLDISNFTTLSMAQADYIKYRVAGVVIGLQDPAVARLQKRLLS